MDDDKLREMFEKYGEITSACVARDHDGKSKGFGFVNFKGDFLKVAYIHQENHMNP